MAKQKRIVATLTKREWAILEAIKNQSGVNFSQQIRSAIRHYGKLVLEKKQETDGEDF